MPGQSFLLLRRSLGGPSHEQASNVGMEPVYKEKIKSTGSTSAATLWTFASGRDGEQATSLENLSGVPIITQTAPQAIL